MDNEIFSSAVLGYRTYDKKGEESAITHSHTVYNKTSVFHYSRHHKASGSWRVKEAALTIALSRPSLARNCLICSFSSLLYPLSIMLIIGHTLKGLTGRSSPDGSLSPFLLASQL